jgi:hypothetical protein
MDNLKQKVGKWRMNSLKSRVYVTLGHSRYIATLVVWGNMLISMRRISDPILSTVGYGDTINEWTLK